jgi:hypothetical protein
MLFKGVNIRQELVKERELSEKKGHSLLKEAAGILQKASERDMALLQRLQTPNYDIPVDLALGKYDAARLFSAEEIHRICTRYRLRFLESNFFKNDFPYDALAEINRIEKENGVQIEKFRMIAPPGMFKLEDRCKKDPLLFAQVNENTFYLIHQWGTDLAWYRRLLVWPLQTIYSLAYTLFALSVLLTFIVPLDWIIRNETNPEQIFYYRIAFFVHSLIFLMGFTLFLGLTFRKNFSESEWDNQCFN